MRKKEIYGKRAVSKSELKNNSGFLIKFSVFSFKILLKIEKFMLEKNICEFFLVFDCNVIMFYCGFIVAIFYY